MKSSSKNKIIGYGIALLFLSACQTGNNSAVENSNEESIYQLDNTNLSEFNQLLKKQQISSIAAIVAKIAPQSEDSEGNYQYKVTEKNPSAANKIVYVTETGLLDDSIEGLKTKIELYKEGQFWLVKSIAKSYRCYTDRGHTNWTKEVCR